MTDADLWEAMVKQVAAITGLVTIQSEGSGPRPALPYCVVSFLGSRSVREHPRMIDWTPDRVDEPDPDTGGNLADITATPLIDTEWHFSVFAYDETICTGRLLPLRSAYELSQILEPMFPTLSVNDMSQVRRVPEVINKKWEERAQCDIFVHGVTRNGFVADTIDVTSVEVNRI